MGVWGIKEGGWEQGGKGDLGRGGLSGSEDILGYSQPLLPSVLNHPYDGEIIPKDIKEAILGMHLLPVCLALI